MKIEYDSTKDPFWQELKNSNIEIPKFKDYCINCGDLIIGTVGQLIDKAPLCNECRETKKKIKSRKSFSIKKDC